MFTGFWPRIGNHLHRFLAVDRDTSSEVSGRGKGQKFTGFFPRKKTYVHRFLAEETMIQVSSRGFEFITTDLQPRISNHVQKFLAADREIFIGFKVKFGVLLTKKFINGRLHLYFYLCLYSGILRDETIEDNLVFNTMMILKILPLQIKTIGVVFWTLLVYRNQ